MVNNLVTTACLKGVSKKNSAVFHRSNIFFQLGDLCLDLVYTVTQLKVIEFIIYSYTIKN